MQFRWRLCRARPPIPALGVYRFLGLRFASEAGRVVGYPRDLPCLVESAPALCPELAFCAPRCPGFRTLRHPRPETAWVPMAASLRVEGHPELCPKARS